jgi:Ion transport protein
MSIQEKIQTNETTSLLFSEGLSPTAEAVSLKTSNSYGKRWIRSLSPLWLPCAYEEENREGNTVDEHPAEMQRRSIRRRIFLLLTEPESSICSAIFFFLTIIAIAMMNLIMILQTMQHWQFTPSDCDFCGKDVSNGVEDNLIMTHQNDNTNDNGIPCVCPPLPLPRTVWLLDRLVRFFTVEWVLRVITFDPPPAVRRSPTIPVTMYQRIAGDWIPFLTSSSTLLDALAIFPYYIEAFTSSNGLLSLRLLRLFRVFQILRLGQYNDTFQSLSAVLVRSIPFLKLFLGVLFLGAALFGSLLYWLEMGTWQYFAPTQSYQFVRLNTLGAPEISPFTSIPVSFWWFAVTVTTVGYGDMAPTTACGQWIAAIAMLLGVLVIAFPVSIFSDLWSAELRRTGALAALQVRDVVHVQLGTGVSERNNDGGLCDRGIMDLNQSPNGLNDETNLDHLVVMRREDFGEIIAQLHVIYESQQHIQSILCKYHVRRS